MRAVSHFGKVSLISRARETNAFGLSLISEREENPKTLETLQNKTR